MGNGAAIVYVVLSAALFFEKPVVATFGAAERLRKLAEAAHDPLAARRLDADPKLKALHSGNLSALQNDPRFTGLLNDPRLNEAAP
jgi:hypothetical protein